MKIDEISITRSLVNTQGQYHLHVEVMGLVFDGWFDDFGGLLLAMEDLGKFIAVRMGKMSDNQARATRSIVPGMRQQ